MSKLTIEDFSNSYPATSMDNYNKILEDWKEAAWEIENVYKLYYAEEITNSRAREIVRYIIDKYAKESNKPINKEWISVDTRLPEKYKSVLCHHVYSGNHFICSRVNDCLTNIEKWENNSMPTHWMLLPSAPNK